MCGSEDGSVGRHFDPVISILNFTPLLKSHKSYLYIDIKIIHIGVFPEKFSLHLGDVIFQQGRAKVG